MLKYNHDVYVLPSGQVEETEYGHPFTRDQVEHGLEVYPEAVFTAEGTGGAASLSSDARSLLEKKEVRITEADLLKKGVIT